ncbi:MAG: hypothetical protein CME88_03965 [Hirschia sp.]|nr:hypothetical protein [Hirschia sp.]MBB35536.1 hypothetical protein [Hirschia sp.]MBF17514.1 hypothetical protein [Hirschia sp.]
MAGVGIFYVAMIAFFIYCQWRVWSKAGFNGAWSLLLLVPIVNLGAYLYFVFADWPVQKKALNDSTFE